MIKQDLKIHTKSILIQSVTVFLSLMSFSSFGISSTDKWIPEKVKLGADLWCPYNCIPDSKDPGLMVEVAQKAFGVKNLVYVILPWKRAIQETKDLEIDGVIAADQDDVPGFIISKPLGKNLNCFYARKDDPWVYKDHKSILEKKLGYITSYTYPDFIMSYIKNKANNENVERSGNTPLLTLLNMLIAKRIDLVIDDESVLNYILNENQNFYQNLKMAGCALESNEVSNIGIAFSPKSKDKSLRLAKHLNITIDEMIKNGEMIKLVEKYKIKKWW